MSSRWRLTMVVAVVPHDASKAAATIKQRIEIVRIAQAPAVAASCASTITLAKVVARKASNYDQGVDDSPVTRRWLDPLAPAAMRLDYRQATPDAGRVLNDGSGDASELPLLAERCHGLTTTSDPEPTSPLCKSSRSIPPRTRSGESHQRSRTLIAANE